MKITLSVNILFYFVTKLIINGHMRLILFSNFKILTSFLDAILNTKNYSGFAKSKANTFGY